MINKSFVQVPYRQGLLHEFGGVQVHGVTDNRFEIPADHSVFGFQVSGFGRVMYKTLSSYKITQGQYFSMRETDGVIWGGHGLLMVIVIPKHKAMFQIGGEIEEVGRLKYIDGCTDSLLVPPVKKGDPCLNHLHFPPGIEQTMHTHPSVRIGVVTKGRGWCVTPFGNLPLETGNVFLILPEGEVSEGEDGKEYPAGSHCFRTYDETMDVIAFHPDSDFGPEDENHPMINRTIVGGVSAAQLTALHTK